MLQLEEYFDKNIKFELNIYKEKSYKETSIDLIWIPYSLELTVVEEKYIIDKCEFQSSSVEKWLRNLQRLIDERKKYTYFDKETNKSVSTVSLEEMDKIMEQYQKFKFSSDEAEFYITMYNTEDIWDDVIAFFEIWMNSRCVLGKESGPPYKIGFRFAVKYDDIRKFYDSLKTQYEEIMEYLGEGKA